jgi:hypothetical protein
MPETLAAIAWPVIRFHFPESDGPVKWTEGDVVEPRLYIFGVIPLGTQAIVPSLLVSDRDPWPKVLRDNGHSWLVDTWDHWIHVEPDAAGGTRYRDEVEVRAGMITPLIWIFARLFYAHRQRRWRKLAIQWRKE